MSPEGDPLNLTDALTVLGASLPANPNLDDPHQAALRVVVERAALADAIVRDLAALECPAEIIVSEVTGDRDGLCPACWATLRSDCLEVEPHDDDCVLQRAQEWTASSGEPSPGDTE